MTVKNGQIEKYSDIERRIHDEQTETSIVEIDASISTLSGLNTTDGILAGWKATRIKRKAIGKALEIHCNSSVENLRVTLRQKNIEYLKILEAKHLGILAELGKCNLTVRIEAGIDIRETISTKLKEIEGKDWPESLKDEASKDIYELGNRLIQELKEDL